jgi:hypothetical protein
LKNKLHEQKNLINADVPSKKQITKRNHQYSARASAPARLQSLGGYEKALLDFLN